MTPQDRWITDAANWKVLVLIMKESGEFWGIGIMEVLCKTLTVILNRHLVAAFTIHKILHVLQDSRGMGIASLKFNLLHKLMYTREEVLYVIFMDLHMACDALDRER